MEEKSSGIMGSQNQSRIEELETTCFVIMPFGKKKVGDREVDFTAIYKSIFEPAIQKARTPEGLPLIPARTDMDAFSGSIHQEMYEYIMYSRLAFADISGFNPNVFYEIGARHSSQESGTVLFRQTGHAIPFDINTIKVFEYDGLSEEDAIKSRSFITNVLSETLKRNRLDSPVRLALRSQWGGATAVSAQAVSAQVETGSVQAQNTSLPVAEIPTSLSSDHWRKQEVERFMRDAEEALRIGDLDMARAHYWGALRFDPLNMIARMRLGLTLKRQGNYHAALEEFITITKLAPSYGEAWKEKGVIEGMIARKMKDSRPEWFSDGYDSLTRATMLIPEDFDVWSSLGGVLKNVRDNPKAAKEMYVKAADISDGHPYPLLNALKLEARETGRLDVDSAREQLEKAAKLRLAQTQATPPADTPWCYFDLAEIKLYQNDKNGFLGYVNRGIESCNASWQPKTFRDSLNDNLVQQHIDFDGLSEGIGILEQATKRFEQP